MSTSPHRPTTQSHHALRRHLLRQYAVVAVPVALVLTAVMLLYGFNQARTSLWTQLTLDVERLAARLSSGEVTADGWQNSAESPRYTLAITPASDSTAQTTTAGRVLRYVLPAGGTPWQVEGTTTGSAIVLETLRAASFPLVALYLMAAWGFVVLYAIGTLRSDKLIQLTTATREAQLGLPSSLDALAGDDDFGRLSGAIIDMRDDLRAQLNERNLLLSMAQDSARVLTVQHGIPSLLRTLQEGAGVAGVRAVVFGSQGGQPLRFGYGPLADDMAKLDRSVLAALRRTEELTWDSAEQITTALQIDTSPVSALMAFALRRDGRLQGAVWLGAENDAPFSPVQRRLAQGVAQQASVLLTNAHLYASAEGGYRRLAAVLASTTEPIAVTDQTDRFIFINPAMEKAFGLNGRIVSGRQVRDVVPYPILRNILIEDINSMNGWEVPSVADDPDLLSRPIEYQQMLQEATEAGRTIYSVSISHVAGRGGETIGRVAVFRDVTRLKQIDHLKTELVSNVSHDLRNPLSYMHTYASMMDEGNLTETQHYYLREITHGINRMHSTIGKLLDLGRIESGVTIYVHPVQLDSLLHGLADAFKAAAEQQGNTITVSVTPPGLVIPGDEALLRSAVNNLINNALVYAPNSGSIDVAAYEEDDRVIITVSDSGPGIPADDVATLFDKFTRGSRRETLNVEGSGLGLAIVKSVAQRHDGEAWVESQLGHGSTFYMAFPKERELAIAA